MTKRTSTHTSDGHHADLDSWRAESVHVHTKHAMVFLSWWQDNVRSELKTSPLSGGHEDTVSQLIISAQHTHTHIHSSIQKHTWINFSCTHTHTHTRACPIILVVYDGVIAGTLAGIRNEAVRVLKARVTDLPSPN